MPPMHSFEQKLAAGWPAEHWRDVTVLLAVSGGADSVALLRAIKALKTEGAGGLVVAHFNHHLRGIQSDADQQFVVALCETLQLESVVGHAPPMPSPAGDNVPEATSRAARYAFLQDVAERRGARYLATAHTADDQAETILHHILRGTGLAGLAGMPRTRVLAAAVTLVRPMLEVTRGEALAYLASLGQPYCEDESNRDLQFTRNRIRHELLPLLARDYSASVVESLLRLGALAADAQHVIDGLVEPLLQRSSISSDATRVTLDCRALAGQDRHLVRELLLAVWRRQTWPLQAMGFAQWNLLAEMALAPAGDPSLRKQVLPGAITAQRQGEQLVLARSETTRGEPPEAQA
jgi:tRNA(Ile)-lysidine synthase